MASVEHDALVTHEQVRFKQTPKTVCAARWIPDKIRERVPGHWASNRERLTAVSVEPETRYGK